MGIVYLGHDPELDREVAVKMLHAHLAEDDHVQRLHQEARTQAKLTHPNVVRIYEVGYHDGHAFIVMQHVDGESLETWLQTERTWQEIVQVFIRAGRGLQAAHEKGIVHRDFKPDNVLIDPGGDVFVADFGLAHAVEAITTADIEDWGATEDPLPRNAPSSRAPTPEYVAPETLRGGVADAWSDQYVFAQALDRALRAPSLAGPPPPHAVRRAIDKGLCQEPERRWRELGGLVLELERALAPSPRGRVLLAVGLLAAVGVGFVASPASEDCPAEAEFRAAFDPAAALPDDPAFEFSRRRLDEYAGRLVSTQRAICEAHGVPSRVPATATLCVDAAKRTAVGLSRFLADQPTQTADPVEAVLALPAPESCADEQGTDLEAGGVATQPELLIGDARAALFAGRPDDAKAIATEALEAAETARAQRSVVHAQLIRGRAVLALSRKDARPLLLEAFWGAEAGAFAKEAGLAALELTLDASLDRDATWAEFWSKMTATQFERAGLAASLGHKAMAAQGNALLTAGDFKGAIARFEEALAHSAASPTPEARHEAVLRGRLSLALANAGRTDEALVEVERAIEITRELYGPDHQVTADLLAKKGRALISAGRYQDAVAALRAAVASRPTDTRVIGTANTRVSLSIALGHVHDFVGAQREAEMGLELLQQEGYGDRQDAGVALSVLAEALAAQDRAEDAAPKISRAIDILTQTLEPKHLGLYEPLITGTEINLALGRTDQAARHYAKAVKLVETSMTGDQQKRVEKRLAVLGDGIRAARGEP